VQARQLAIASAQLRGLRPNALASLQNYIERVESNQKTVADLQAGIANTKKLRALLATVEATNQ
jgi:hypothetical protein